MADDLASYMIGAVATMSPREVHEFCDSLTPERVMTETGCVVTQEQIRACIDRYILIPRNAR